MPYSDKLSPQDQIDAEEMIAAHVFDFINSLEEGISETTAGDLGRELLRVVLEKFRPDLFVPEEKLKSFTVIGVYVTGDSDCIGERFADHVKAPSWQRAEQMVLAKRGNDVAVAGVLDGEVMCVDEQ